MVSVTTWLGFATASNADSWEKHFCLKELPQVTHSSKFQETENYKNILLIVLKYSFPVPSSKG